MRYRSPGPPNCETEVPPQRGADRKTLAWQSSAAQSPQRTRRSAPQRTTPLLAGTRDRRPSRLPDLGSTGRAPYLTAQAPVICSVGNFQLAQVGNLQPAVTPRSSRRSRASPSAEPRCSACAGRRAWSRHVGVGRLGIGSAAPGGRRHGSACSSTGVPLPGSGRPNPRAVS
jgi:hypothetical protein